MALWFGLNADQIEFKRCHDREIALFDISKLLFGKYHDIIDQIIKIWHHLEVMAPTVEIKKRGDTMHVNKLKNTQQTELHAIGKMMAYAITRNTDDAEYPQLLEDIKKKLRKMPKVGKIALRSAWIFSRKVPQPERDDFFQELFLELWKKRIDSEKLAYTIARCDWQDWFKKFKIRQHYSLDMLVNEDDEQSVPYGELLVSAVDYEAQTCLTLDCMHLLKIMPADVKKLVMRRLSGKGLNGSERVKVNRWAHKHVHLMA